VADSIRRLRMQAEHSVAHQTLQASTVSLHALRGICHHGGSMLDSRKPTTGTLPMAMAARQRAGVGPTYGDDGHWIADHLRGSVVANPAGRLINRITGERQR